MMIIRTTADEFSWLVISKADALKVFNFGLGRAVDLCMLYDDETESMPNSEADIMAHRGEMGVEIGTIPDEEHRFDVAQQLWVEIEKL